MDGSGEHVKTMKRYDFGSFDVTPANRAAFQACRRISELKYPGPFPVVLVGEKGCGKTHLLYSIVNHIRTVGAKAGLAVVTASRFPEEVRALIPEPAPVKRARSAVLVVDQVESFDKYVDELAAIVRLFLDYKHIIVMASEVSPDQLTNIPPALRDILCRGTVVAMEAGDAARDTGANEQVERLRVQLEESLNAVSDAEARTTVLQNRLDLVEISQLELNAQLACEREAAMTLEAEIEKLKQENRELQRDLDSARGQVGELEPLTQELARARDAIAAAQSERAAAEGRCSELESELSVIPRLREEAQQAQRVTELARQETAEIQQAYDALAAKAQTLVEQVESYSAYYAHGAQAQCEQLAELVRLLDAGDVRRVTPEEAELAVARAERAQAELDAARRAFATIRESLETQLAQAVADAGNAVRERTALNERLAQMELAHATLQEQANELRRQAEAAERDMDALRQEAAEQVAAANAQAGEIERRVMQLVAAQETERMAGTGAAGDLATLREDLIRAAGLIEAIGGKLHNAFGGMHPGPDAAPPDNLSLFEFTALRDAAVAPPASEEPDDSSRAASSLG